MYVAMYINLMSYATSTKVTTHSSTHRSYHRSQQTAIENWQQIRRDSDELSQLGLTFNSSRNNLFSN